LQVLAPIRSTGHHQQPKAHSFGLWRCSNE
jgi:hypothetical protein